MVSLGKWNRGIGWVSGGVGLVWASGGIRLG